MLRNGCDFNVSATPINTEDFGVWHTPQPTSVGRPLRNWCEQHGEHQ